MLLYVIICYYMLLYVIICYYMLLYYIILYYQDAGFDCNDDGGDGADTMTKTTMQMMIFGFSTIHFDSGGCTASSGTSQGTWYNCCRPMNGVSVKPVAFGILGVEGWCRGTEDPTCRKSKLA